MKGFDTLLSEIHEKTFFKNSQSLLILLTLILNLPKVINFNEAEYNLTKRQRNKKDFDKFSGLDLEHIKGTKNHYSIRINLNNQLKL